MRDETCLMLTDESKQQYASAMADKKTAESRKKVKAREAGRGTKGCSFEQREIHRIKKNGQSI